MVSVDSTDLVPDSIKAEEESNEEARDDDVTEAKQGKLT